MSTDTGIKFDNEKPRCDLVFAGFADALLEVAKVGTFGAKKYTDNGWREVSNGRERYRSALYRHMLADDIVDEDSGLLHSAHAAWNALAVLQMELAEAAEAPHSI